MDFQEYLDFAIEIAKDIAPTFKEGFVIANKVSWKSDSDPVTEYDKKIEQRAKDLILKRYPHHVVLGEEDGLSSSVDSDFQWIIDPIDGTINYIRGVPFVAFSLALTYKGELIVSVVSNPIMDEYFWALKGKGAYLNGEKTQVSTCIDLKKSYLVLGRYNEKYAVPYHRTLKHFQSVRNPGAAALALAYVAAGRMEGALYFRLSPWDMAGGVLLVQEAGGIVTNIDGSEFTLEEPSILAASPFVYPIVHDILNT